MDLATFNALPPDAAAAQVRPCADIDRFVAAVVAGRPYADVAAAVAVARRQAATWSADEVEAALADHPRIGERHGGTGASAAMSAAEQGGVRTAPALSELIAEGNRRYEERFGRIFLVRAFDRSPEEILEQLRWRLENDPSTEVQVTTSELADIAVLRLRAVLS